MGTENDANFIGLPPDFGDKPTAEFDPLGANPPNLAEILCAPESPGIVPSATPFITYLAGLSKRTRQTATSDLNNVARMAGFEDAASAAWEKLDYSVTQMIRSNLAEKYPPASANRILSTVRGVLKAAWRLNLMDSETYYRASDIKPVRGKSLPAGRCVTENEIKRLFAICAADESAAGVRDAAIISLLYGAGLRREEVATILLSDYNATTGEIRIKGKGNKERMVLATNGGKTALDDWIHLRATALWQARLVGTDAIFLSLDRWGNIGDPITHVAIYKMFVKRCAEAGITGISPHDMRRTFITEQLGIDTDIKTVADMAGHTRLDTTAGYDKRGEEAKKKAFNMMHVPYRGKE